MRSHLFILAACVFSLAAQDAWEAVAHPADGPGLTGHPAWRFLRREGVGRAALFSEELFTTRVSAEFRRELASEAAFQALGRKLNLAVPPIWALLDPEGQVRLHGTAEPTSRALREALEAGGWSPRWERRQVFLREHPEQGDATLEALWEMERRFLQLRMNVEAQRQKGPVLAVSWNPGDPTDPQMIKALATPLGQAEVVRPCQQALAWFRALPAGDPECTQAWSSLYNLSLGGMSSHETLAEEFRGILSTLEDRLRRDPARVSLWRTWIGLATILPRVEGEALVASLEPAPGTPWPIREAAQAVTLHLDAQQRLDRAESELAAAGDASARLRAWAGIKLGALLELKRVDEARAWIIEAREQHRESFEGVTLDPWVSEKDPARASLQAALDQEVDTAPEEFVDLCLVLLGRPAWVQAFEGLQHHPALDAWGRGSFFAPGELGLLHLEGPEEQEIRTRLNLPPGPRWVLARASGECLAQGTEAPEPRQLAEALRKAHPALLERLEAFLRIHPDHRQARERLVETLAARMPHPRLELKLAQACGALGEAPILRSTDFKPQVPLWEPVARKALPEAEARLARWPESLDAWMAWMDWHSVLPVPASPTERLRGLAVWKTLLQGGPGPVPLKVAAGVARRLEQAGRWKHLAEWGLHQWEGGCRGAMGWRAESSDDESPREKEERQQARKDLLTLAQLTSRALFTLDRKADLQRFLDEWRAADPTRGMDQGRVKP